MVPSLQAFCLSGGILHSDSVWTSTRPSHRDGRRSAVRPCGAFRADAVSGYAVAGLSVQARLGTKARSCRGGRGGVVAAERVHEDGRLARAGSTCCLAPCGCPLCSDPGGGGGARPPEPSGASALLPVSSAPDRRSSPPAGFPEPTVLASPGTSRSGVVLTPLVPPHARRGGLVRPQADWGVRLRLSPPTPAYRSGVAAERSPDRPLATASTRLTTRLAFAWPWPSPMRS